jgi:hypothetical protein
MLDDTLVAPRSGRRCVAYGVHLHPPETMDPDDAGIAELDDVELRPFVLECDLGHVVVVGEAAELALPYVHVPAERVDEERWLAFCAHRGLSPRARVTEAILEPGATVVVVGVVQYRAAPGRDVAPGDPGVPCLLVGDADRPLIIAEPATP